MKTNNRIYRFIKSYYVLLIIFSIGLSFICVGSSPLLDYMDPDSQNFRLLGRALQRGQVAYIDIFDHKGPYIYLIEYLGAILSPHSEWGIFFIEVVCYCINICTAYKIANLFVDEKSAFLSALAFLGLSFNFFTFVTGNLTDSYSVTCQIITLYLITKYFKSGNTEHPALYMAIYGITACACGLMRPVNAGGWITLGIVLAIRLFYFKKIKNFFENLTSLVIGIIVGFLPAVYYGLKHNCVEEMWYGTIVANMQYAGNSSEAKNFGEFLKEFVLDPSFAIVLLSVISIIIVAKFSTDVWMTVTFSMMFLGQLFFMNVSLRTDGQYNQLYMVYTLPALVFIVRKAGNLLKTPILIMGIVILTLLANLQLIKQITKFGVFNYHYDAACAMRDIINDPDAEILVTGTHSLYYNVTDTVPHIRYFIIYGHGLHYEVFPDAVNMQAGSILSGENEYVVVNYNTDGTIFGISDIDNKVNQYLLTDYSILYKTVEGINTVLYKKIKE